MKLEVANIIFERRFNMIGQTYNLNSDIGRVAYLSEACELIASAPEEVNAEAYILDTAGKAGVSVAAVAFEVLRIVKKTAASTANTDGGRAEQNLTPVSASYDIKK